VPNWPGYRVSNTGILQSCRNHGGRLTNNWRVKKPSMSRDGYKMIGLHNKRKILFTSIHSLVLSAFIGPRPIGLQACHNNSNKKDNTLLNLRWDTPKANIADRDKNGPTSQGERNGRAKIKSASVRHVRRLRREGMSFMKIAMRFGISKRQVMRIVTGFAWSHIT